MDLFQATRPQRNRSNEPLAARMAPTQFDEFFGQEHLVAVGGLLRRSIEADRLTSSIFFGPPGTGKTALARLAARKSQAAIEYINAVTAGVADLRNVVKRAIDRRRLNGQKTLLIVDEIHHFNKTQQDALLPDVERGNLILIGLTTENPFYYVNAALMSRSTAFEFKSLTPNAMKKIMDHALTNKERGVGEKKIDMSDEARQHILRTTDGDARRLLNALELAVTTTAPNSDGIITIDLKTAESSTQIRPVRYDKKGDEHFDTISAFIKSLRGSDPDAAIYWMAKMIHAGEDPRFIARRLVIFASEDVGNADPHGLVLANACAQALEMIGMPEGRIILGQTAAYLASAPKSNRAYLAINQALEEVARGPRREVPNHLKDSNRDGETLGHGKDYLYPHDFPGHYVNQEYMPQKIEFYKPSDQGTEKEISKRLNQWRNKKYPSPPPQK